MLASLPLQVMSTHLVQFTIALIVLGAIATLCARKWPHLAFLLMMLALIKSIAPPIFSSPTGVFSWADTLSVRSEHWDPEYALLEQAKWDIHQDRAYMDTLLSAGSEGVSQNHRAISADAFQMLTATLIGLWAVVALALLIKSTYQLRRVTGRIEQRSKPPSRDLLTEFANIRQRFGLSQPVRLLVSDDKIGPGCFGIRQPTVVLPKSMLDAMPTSQIGPVLAHELMHIRRGDIYWGYLQMAARIIWWFHPGVWWANRLGTRLCEKCVDEQVLATEYCSAGDYAESLVMALNYAHPANNSPLVRHLSAAELTSKRIQRLQNRNGKFKRRTCKVGWGMTLLAAVAFLPGMGWNRGSLKSNSTLTEKRDELLACLESKNLSGAETLLRSISQTNPSALSYFLLSSVQEAQGKVDNAMTTYSKALSMEDGSGFVDWLAGVKPKLLEIDSEPSEVFLADDIPALTDNFGFNASKANTSLREELSVVASLQDTPMSCASAIIERLEQFESHASLEQGAIRQLAEQRVVRIWTESDLNSKTQISFWIDWQGRITELHSKCKADRLELLAYRYSPFGSTLMLRQTLFQESDEQLKHVVQQSQDRGRSWVCTTNHKLDTKPAPKTKPVTWISRPFPSMAKNHR